MFDALLTFVADAFVWLVMGGVALRVVLNGLGSVMGGPRNPDYGKRETNTTTSRIPATRAMEASQT